MVLTPTIGEVEFVQTPNFVFPMRPGPQGSPAATPIRDLPVPAPTTPSHLRHGLQRKSASALPTFAFNASDTSGLGASTPPSAGAANPSFNLSPLRDYGHRRGASELVGARSAATPNPSSPFNFIPAVMLPNDTPSRKGHAHRRSAAISVSEISYNLLQHECHTTNAAAPTPNALGTSDHARPARSRVGFSDHVEYIPRPLSIVSTESGATVTALTGTDEGTDSDTDTIDNVSCETENLATPGLDHLKEGQWLKRVAASMLGTEDNAEASPDILTLSLAGAVDLDDNELHSRHLSEQFSSRFTQVSAGSETRVDANEGHLVADKSLMFDMVSPRDSTSFTRPELPPRAWSAPIPTLGSLTSPQVPDPQGPDLEELFRQDPFDVEDDMNFGPPRLDLSQISNFRPLYQCSGDDSEHMIDLDVATVPMDPTSTRDVRLSMSAGGMSGRRQLHSSRLANQPGLRRRAESAPLLTPFEYSQCSSPTQSPMADVFEEDEDEDATVCPVECAEANLQLDHVPERDLLGQDGLGIQQMRAQGSGTVPSAMTGQIDVVHAEEEPRESRCAKLVEDGRLALSIPLSTQASLMTPTTYAASTFSSPDNTRRQNSFDTSRLGTSASSCTDCKTTSSSAPETPTDLRPSVERVPSLTSTRSTMSRKLDPRRHRHGRNGRSASGHELSGDDQDDQQVERRRKRSSIHTLSRLVGTSFGGGDEKDEMHGDQDRSEDGSHPAARKEKRLSRLLFWKNRRSPRTA